MLFKNSCFISYRNNGQSELTKRLVEGLEQALKEELGMLLEEETGIFLDKVRIEKGDIIDKQIAQELCKSLCLIVLYTPAYLSRDRTYCARELCAMKQLENRRLQMVGAAEKSKGLIIPIAIRGKEAMPDELKKRAYHDFEEFDLTHPKLNKHKKYTPKIREIAEYISDRYKCFKNLGVDLCTNCADFELPDAGSEEVQMLINHSSPQFVR